MEGVQMLYTKEKVDQTAKAKLEQYLENVVQEALQTDDADRELLLMACYFVGSESLKKGTFMVIQDDLLQKHIIVPGIPFEIFQSWTC